jgi:hypothetical protein
MRDIAELVSTFGSDPEVGHELVCYAGMEKLG